MCLLSAPMLLPVFMFAGLCYYSSIERLVQTCGKLQQNPWYNPVVNVPEYHTDFLSTIEILEGKMPREHKKMPEEIKLPQKPEGAEPHCTWFRTMRDFFCNSVFDLTYVSEKYAAWVSTDFQRPDQAVSATWPFWIY